LPVYLVDKLHLSVADKERNMMFIWSGSGVWDKNYIRKICCSAPQNLANWPA